jgi:membrane protease YdiL (CAAX protease family)
MKSIFNKEIIYVLIITIIVAIMDISGIPTIILFTPSLFDINPILLSLFINFIIIIGFIFLSKKLLFPSWDFAFNKKYLVEGIKKYGVVTLLIFIITTLAFYIGLKPLNYNPSVYKIIFEGIIYYIGVGFIEELYIRGLLLNVIEILFKKKNNSTLIAIIISSVIFGIGHVFGSIDSSLLVIVSKVIWTISLGLFLGVIYKKSNCLLLSIIAHSLIDFSAIAFVYKKDFYYPSVSLIIIIPLYIALGFYSIYVYKKGYKFSSSRI